MDLPGRIEGSAQPAVQFKCGPISCFMMTNSGSPPSPQLGEELRFSRLDSGGFHVGDGAFGGKDCRSASGSIPAFSGAAAPSVQLLPPEAAIVQRQPLRPLGSGWHDESLMTDDMRSVRCKAIEAFEAQEKKQLTPFNLDFLTTDTLKNYVNPTSLNHLVTTLKRRADVERMLTVTEPIFLNGSLRVIGWDGDGISIIASEPSTMRKAMSAYVDQIEYVIWSALDLSKPGDCRYIAVNFLGGGFNPMHYLNPKPLTSLASFIEGQWRRRLKTVYLVEMSRSFEFVFNLMMGLVKEHTKEKVRLISTAEDMCKELRRIGCDEEMISAWRATVESRRSRSTCQRWFPVIDHPFFKAKLASLKLDQDLEYFTIEHHKRFREAIDEFRVWKWGNRHHDSSTGSHAGDLRDSRCDLRGPATNDTNGSQADGMRGSSRGSSGVRFDRVDAQVDYHSLPAVAGAARPASKIQRADSRPRTFLQRVAACCSCGACGG